MSTKHHAFEAHGCLYATRKREALGRSPSAVVECRIQPKSDRLLDACDLPPWQARHDDPGAGARGSGAYGAMMASPRIARQFLHFAMVGGIATAIQYLILIALVRGADMNAVLASTFGFTVSAACNYYLNYHFTFRSNAEHRRAIIKFLAVAGVGLTLNSLTMMIAAHFLGVHYLLAQVIATGLVLLWNFSGNRWWTFKRV